MDRLAILGAGSFGTALAIAAAQSGTPVTLWARREAAAAAIRVTRRNDEYLPEGTLPESVRVTADLEEALGDARLWLYCTPAQTTRALAEETHRLVRPDVLAFCASKGIENGSLMTMSEVLQDVLAVRDEHVGVLYGPSHAEEVARGVPTALVAASSDETAAHAFRAAFMSNRLRVYVNDDVRGVEVAGSVKNVMAIAAGMSDGLGGGDNTKAALITRGMAEITRLGLALGARPVTFMGLAGIGDLVVTCMSRHSRNRSFGEMMGQGRTMQEALDAMTMVAEGVPTTQSVHALAQREGVEMPISEAVYRVLFEGMNPLAGLAELMARAPKHEDYLVGSDPEPDAEPMPPLAA